MSGRSSCATVPAGLQVRLLGWWSPLAVTELVGLRDDLLLMSPDWLFHDPWYVAGATDVLGMDVAAAEVRWNDTVIELDEDELQGLFR